MFLQLKINLIQTTKKKKAPKEVNNNNYHKYAYNEVIYNCVDVKNNINR